MIQFVRANIFIISILILLFLANIIFTTLPLLNLLSYESSAVNAILFSLLSGIYWLAKFEKSSFKSIIVFLLLLISIPFLILIFSTLVCQNCPLSDGIYFYFVIAVVSIFTGIAIASFSKFISIKYKYWLFVIFWLFILLGFLPELYYNPQIYFYNPIFGYYPGVIYDQTIEITDNLLLYRFIVLVISIILIIIFSKKNKVRGKIKFFTFVGIIILYFLFSLLKPILNFSTTLANIREEITSEVETDNFKIIFPASLTKNEIEILKYDHEFYYKIISDLLNIELESKITSIIFESGAQKKDLFGSANADVAKPWLNQIYLNFPNYQNSLKHEIAHIFSAKFAEGLFNLPSNFNPAMIEGFAMAIENNYDDQDIDYLAALAFQNEYKISLENLFSDFSFFANASSLSYIYAGSFIKYLANLYGWEKIKEIYSDDNFVKVYGVELAELEQDYLRYLEKITIQENNHSSNFYFGRKPLIKKYCARATAKELRNAKLLYTEKKYDESYKLFSKIYSYSDSYSALVGLVQAKREMNQINLCIEILENETHKLSGTAYYYYLELLLADFYALNSESKEASKYYEKIIEQNPHNSYIISAELRKKLLLQSDSHLIKYLTKPNSRIDYLLELTQREPSNSLLQIVCATEDLDSTHYSEIKQLITLIDDQKISYNTYFALSKLSYRFLDFGEAIRTAEKAYIKSDFKSRAIISEHLSKMNWIINVIENK